MGDRPVHGPLLEAHRVFEARLAEMGESQVCFAGLPALADEVAARAADGDPQLEAEIRLRLRARVGISPTY